ncbi:unnamed protein product [Cylindrotheca closterium]|uniref:Uncharacterized protein n=1 Tax=Cylindrotheca closterium TaxID=2856 RepID=A0AAD2GEH2_9STRA|nr:unnamed protein product [Cylindrotheca closterium]
MHNESETPLAALIEQIGGESQFNFLIRTFSESVLQDNELEVAFKGMNDAEALTDHMANLIKRVFGYKCKSSMTNSTIRGQIILRNYALFDLELRRSHLRKLQLHFEAAMRDSMVEGDVFEHCRDRFHDLCKIFDSRSRGLQKSSPSIMSINDPASIMIRAASDERLKGGLNDPARKKMVRPVSNDRFKGLLQQRSSSSTSILNDPAKIMMGRTASNELLKGLQRTSPSSRSTLDDRAKLLMARAASNRHLLPNAA